MFISTKLYKRKTANKITIYFTLKIKYILIIIIGMCLLQTM